MAPTFDILRCANSSNPCGTDTVMLGNFCECTPCRQWLAAFNQGKEAARIEALQVAGSGMFGLFQQPTFGGRFALDNQAQPSNRICTQCSGSGIYIDYGGLSVGGVNTRCKVCNGAGWVS